MTVVSSSVIVTERKKRFRLRSSELFLTYKLCHELPTKDVVHGELRLLLSSRKAKITTLIISFEESDDDHPYKHFHVYMKFDRHLDLKNPKALDLRHVHGQYERVRNTAAAIAYTIKDSDYIVDGDAAVVKTKSKLTIEQLTSHLYSNALLLLGSKWTTAGLKPQQAIDKVGEGLVEADRSKYYLHKGTIDKAVKLMMQSSHIEYFPQLHLERYPKESFEIPAPVVEWRYTDRQIKTLTFVLLGPSGCGKTELAKSLFANPLVVNEIDQLKDLTESHDAIIFDDCELKRLTRERVINLLDVKNTHSVDVKHSHSIISRGIPKMLLSNRKFEELFSFPTDPAVERRVIKFTITMKQIYKLTVDMQNYYY